MGGNPFEMSSDLMQGAAGGYEQLGNYDAPGRVGDYMNPYTETVIDNTMNDMTRQNDMLLDQNADAAIASGAFGGGRHGVTDAITNAETVRNMGNISGQMRDAGYNTAMDNVFRNAGLMQGAAAGAQSLGGNYFNVGNQLLGNQQAQGDLAQGVNQGVIGDAGGIFAGNDIMGLLNQFQGALGSNPLMGENTQTGTYHPGTMEKVGMGVGLAGDLMGK